MNTVVDITPIDLDFQFSSAGLYESLLEARAATRKDHLAAIVALDWNTIATKLFDHNAIDVVKTADTKYPLCEVYRIHKFESGQYTVNQLANPFQILINNHFVIGRRQELEKNPDFRQILPYSVVYRTNPTTGQKEILTYRRLKGGGESKLYKSTSVGFGGHVDIEEVAHNSETSEVNISETVVDNSRRELNEELKFVNTGGTEVYATHDVEFEDLLIVDTTNEVGCCHIGFLHMVEVAYELTAFTKEPDQIELAGFLTIDELTQYNDLEVWSHVVLEQLYSVDFFQTPVPAVEDPSSGELGIVADAPPEDEVNTTMLAEMMGEPESYNWSGLVEAISPASLSLDHLQQLFPGAKFGYVEGTQKYQINFDSSYKAQALDIGGYSFHRDDNTPVLKIIPANTTDAGTTYLLQIA